MTRPPKKSGARKAGAPKAGARKAGARKAGAHKAGAHKVGGRRAADSAPSTNAFAGSAPSAGDSAGLVRVSRILDAPAAAILRAITDADRRGWAPTPLFRVVSVLAPRFVRLALPDGSDVGIAITRQGNTRCAVQVEHSKWPASRSASVIRAEWMASLAGLAEQLDAEWD